MKRYLKFVAIALLASAILLLLGILFAPYLGWRIDTVLSGSMSPTLQVGSAAVTRPVDPQTIRPDDIVTYRSPRNGEMTTHRVVAIEEGESRLFGTKGDANEEADPYMVPALNIEGRVIVDVPLLGYVARSVKTPLGFGLLLGLPGMLIIAAESRKIWRELSTEGDSRTSKVGDHV
jgi:signal peptidase